MVSPLMLNSYIQFGDLLHLKVLANEGHGQIQGLKVALFTVVDTNERSLLAGVALFEE